MVVARKRQQRQPAERGAAAVEFMLVAPLLILLVFAIVQFGLLLNAWQGVHAAAREGARVGSLQGATVAQVNTRVNGALAGVAVEGTPTISVTPCSGTGSAVTVAVTTVRSIDIPFWTARNVTLTGQGQFRCEG